MMTSSHLPERPLAQGSTAEVYDWGPELVLKLFRSGFSRAAIEQEYEVSRQIAQSSVATPRVFELLDVAERTGIVYERIVGISLMQHLMSGQEDPVSTARQLADLQVAHFDVRIDGLRGARDRLGSKIREANNIRTAQRLDALETLQRLPTQSRLCHGDFHPDNVLITATGPVVIDWADAYGGSPESDIGRTLLLMRFGTPPSGTPPELEQVRKAFTASYLERICTNWVVSRSELERWLFPLVVGRFSEGIHPSEASQLQQLLAQISRESNRLPLAAILE